MVSGSVPVLTCMLLLSTLCPDVLARRGGFGGAVGRWGGIGRAGGWGGAAAHKGGGHHYKALHVNKGSSAGKIAGAAAAGAVGGMVIGHGLGSMSRPGYGHGYGYGHDHARYGGYDGYGGGHGHPRLTGGHMNGHVQHSDRAGFRNETDMEYYVGGASRGQTYSYVLLFGSTVSILFGYWGS